MAQKRVIRSFNAGEISPDLYGRDDIAKVTGGCLVMDNMMLTIQGAAHFRGGMSYESQTKDNSKALLIRFAYNDTDVYILEFGNKYIRFFRKGKILKDSDGVPLQLTTPYVLSDLWEKDGTPAINIAQTGDVVYLFNSSKKYPVQRLERNKDGTFTLAEVDYAEDGGFEDINMDRDVRVWASAQNGENVVISATKSIFKQGHIGGLFYIEPVNFNGIYSWSEGKEVKKDQRIVSNYKTYRAENAGTTGDTTPKHTEGVATDGKTNWVYEDCGYGIGKIISIAEDGKSAVVNVLLSIPFAAVGEARKTWKWKFGSWCEEYGYPTCGCFHRERLVVSRGSRTWFSWSDDFENFAEKDFGAITYQTGFGFNVSSGVSVGSIQWMESGKDLVCGTDVNIAAVAESNTSDLFYVTNCRSFEQTTDACRHIKPVRVGQRFVFVDITGTAVNTLTYNINNYQYDSDTLQTYAKHICVEGITDMVHIKEPFDVIYCLKSNGTLSCCLYSPNQEGLAWYRLKTDGEIVSIAADTANLALCVKRKRIVDGVEQDNYGIEFLNNPFQGFFSKTIADFNTEKEYKQYCADSLLEAQKEACYLDASNVYTSGVEFKVIDEGLDHLAGRTVSIVSEGGIEPEQEVKLVNGKWTITLKDWSKIAIVGLPYKGVVIPTPLESDGETSAAARIRRVNRVGYKVYNSMGGQFGDTMDSLKDILVRSGGDDLNNPIPLFSGNIELSAFNGDYSEAEQIIFLQPYPLPFILQAIVFEFEVY